MSIERKCDEEKATEEEKEEKAAGAELKTKTPHNDVGKKPGFSYLMIFSNDVESNFSQIFICFMHTFCDSTICIYRYTATMFIHIIYLQHQEIDHIY